MSRYLGPRLRITRRLGHLSGLTRKKPSFKPVNPVNPFGPRKIIPPGQHGRNKSFKKKPYESCEYDYLIRLKLKQRLRFHYGLTEKQLVRYVQQAKKIKGSTGRVLLRLLEMRLDNIVFRLHMAPTIKAARQLISHGHILVNKKKVTIPSYQCQPKDIVTVAPKIISMELVSRFLTEFDKEKYIYDRILKILEFGRKGVTMKLAAKNAKSFKNKSSLLKKELLRKGLNSKSFGTKAKVQKLKIGTVLNVTIQNRGRKEAEAISYAFGKMIVIHPFFVGKQSLNKTVRVVIYKKSKNNRILYTYPANPFYLRLENLRKLNSLDVAKLFSNSINQISYKFNQKNKSSSFINKKRNVSKTKNTSALILMNASKVLPKNSLDRRKRLIMGQNSTLENNQVNNERTLSPSVFIRIIAAKCLNKSKQTSGKLSSFLNSLKKVNPTFTKDPVAYREKYVYTKTSKVLRLFGTRFYAKILKNKNTGNKAPKSNFVQNKSTDKRTVRKNNFNNEKSLLSRSSKNSQILNLNNLSKSSNSLPFALKSSTNQVSLTKVFSDETCNVVNNTKNNSKIGLFKQYLNLFNKLAFLKTQKNIGKAFSDQNVDCNKLKNKILNTFLFESKKLSFKPANMDHFILLFFQKLSNILAQKNNTTFTKQNILLISKNLRTFWCENLTADLDCSTLKNSKQFSNDMLVFLLKVTSVYKNIEKTNYQLSSIKIDNLIKNNISFLFLLDKIKNNLQNNFNFINSFFSSDFLISSILPYFNGKNIYSVLTQLDNISLNICSNLLNLIKANLNLVKLTKIKNNLSMQSESKLPSLHQLSQNLVNFEQNIFKLTFDKFVNCAMVSVPKAVFLVESETLLFKNLNISNKSLSQSVDTLSFDSVQKQKVLLVKTLTFLKQKNLILDSKVDKFKKVIKNVLQNQIEILSYLKTSFILNKNSKQLENLLSLDLRSKLQQKILATEINQKLLLLDRLNYNNIVRSKTKVSLEILQRKTNLFKTLSLMKDFHLIKVQDFNSVHTSLNSHFYLLEKLQGLLTTTNIEISLDLKIKIQQVLAKNFEKIDQILTSVNNFCKLFYTKLEKSYPNNSLAKQKILQNILVAKNQFSQNLLQNSFVKTDLAIFIQNVHIKNMKHYKFILQLQKIMNINVLKEVTVFSNNTACQMFADVKEKLAFKGLTKINTILSKLLVDNKLKKVDWNQRIDLLSLDSFLKTSFFNYSKIQEIGSHASDDFWKKVVSVLTPSKMVSALKTLKDLNNFSNSMYDTLLLKLNNLYTLNQTFNLSLSKQYFTEKLSIIFKSLVFISQHLKINTFMNLNLFNNTTWGLNTISNLGLQKQNNFREISKTVNNRKTKLLLNFKLQKESYAINANQLEKVGNPFGINSLLQIYIENQFNGLLNKLAGLDLVPYNTIIINSELNSITNNVKLFLKLHDLKDNHVSNRNKLLFNLNKDLNTKLLNLLKNKQNFFTDMEYKQLNNTFKKVTGSSLSVKLSRNFVDNLTRSTSIVETTFSLNILQKNILKVYNYSFTPVYYNFQSNFNSSFDYSSLQFNKLYLYKVLNNLKLNVNNTKLLNLIGELSQNETLQLKYKSSIYQTFTNLALIENYVLCNKGYNFKFNNKQVLQNAKALYLKQFYQNLKFLIYVTNLDKLKNMDIISDQQYLEYKANYENIFKLVKKQIILLNVLNKRKKWNFINYSTYQNLVRSIYKNLTGKIKGLVQKMTNSNNIKRDSLSNSLELKNIETVAHETNKFSRNKLNLLSSNEVNTMVQQTLEQLVNTSDLALNNVNALVSNFVSRIIFASHEHISQQLQVENITAKTVIKPFIKETYKRLVSVHKKLELAGPWSVDSLLLKTKQKQKTLILRNFVNNVKTSENKISYPIYNKFIKISFFENFLKEKLKNYRSNLYNSVNGNSTLISVNSNKYSSLLKVVENLQFKLQKDYLTKFNNGLLNVEVLNSLNLDVTKFNEFSNFYNSNSISGKPAFKIYYTKFVFQALWKHLLTTYTTQKFNIEFKHISKFQKVQFIKTILLNYALREANMKNSLIKMQLSKLLTDILTLPQHQMLLTSSTIEKLVQFEASLKASVTVAKVSNSMMVQIQRNMQKTKLRKTILALKHLETLYSHTQFNTVKYSTLLLDVLSRLYDLKTNNIISERKYSFIKQKLKIFSLFLILNEKLTSLKEKGLINLEKAVQLQKQIIQKINQKIKKAKTFSKFKSSLKSLTQLTKKGTIKPSSEKTTSFHTSASSSLNSLNAGGRWSKVTLKQLVKQKLLNNRQEEKLNIVFSNQDNNKIKKLRRIISVLVYSRQILENTRNANSEQLIKDVIGSALQSFTGSWKRVLFNLLSNQNFKSSIKPVLLNNVNSNSQFETSSTNISTLNNFEAINLKTKVTKLLSVYYHQILILRQLKTNRTISSNEFEQKFKNILENISLLLEKGGLEAFKVIYNTKWINLLLKNTEKTRFNSGNFKNSKNIKFKSQKNKAKRTNQNSSVREFSLKYNFYKNLYFNLYKKSVLKNKIKLFHSYKKNLLNELLVLENIVINDQTFSAKSGSIEKILTSSRLNYLKQQGIIDSNTKTYKKLAFMLTTSLQRLAKLDRLLKLQNLYMYTNEAKNTTENTNYSTTISEGTSSPEITETFNRNPLILSFSKLKQKIIQSYLRFEYKQIEKSLNKQKLFVKNLNVKVSKKKQNSKIKLVKRNKYKTFSVEQFNSFFQQLLNFLDSRYKSGGRNRRNPRINSIIRRLNQKLAFDKTLTKKFGDHLQKFIEKRFGPALPIPPHLELKRWKIKNAKLQSKQKANFKYLILPVGIVHDLAPRRSVGLPILERLIVEYYSRN